MVAPHESTAPDCGGVHQKRRGRQKALECPVDFDRVFAMAYLTLDPAKESLDTLRARIVFSLARLLSDPNGAPYRADFQALREEWNTVNAKESSLEDFVLIARAGVVFADRVLDAFVEKVKNTIHKGKKPDLTLPLHVLFFGSLAPAVFERPILGSELNACIPWPDLLAKATHHPELQALSSEGAEVVAAGSVASAKSVTAIAERDGFRKGGERDAFFAKFNALCAKVHGGLTAMVHDHPELGLEKAYAGSFFMHTTATGSGKPTTAATAATAVTQLTMQLADAQKLHDQLVAEEAQRAEALRSQAAAETKAAELRKVAKETDKAAKDAEIAAKKLSKG
jgi:hypothetical protein